MSDFTWADAVVIREADLIDSVADALQFISYYHPMDYIRALGDAYEAEQGPAAKDAIAQILTNSRMCAEGHRPICQDTGIVTVFLDVGMDVRWEGFTGSLEDAVNEGVRRAYSHPDNKLRASVLADPAGKRINTKDNTPCVIHARIVPGGKLDVIVAAKGGGSEHKAAFATLNPSDDIVKWVAQQGGAGLATSRLLPGARVVRGFNAIGAGRLVVLPALVTSTSRCPRRSRVLATASTTIG